MNSQSESKWRHGTAYLQVRPDSAWWLKVVKATQRRPATVDAGCVVIKLKLRIPDRAFNPLEPEAVVTVPEELTQQPIEVEAADPS